MKMTQILVSMGAMALLGAGAMAQDADEDTPFAEELVNLPGMYSGNYFCTGSGEHGLTLSVDALGERMEDGGYPVTATLWFYPVLANPDGPKGAFRMEGSLASDFALNLTPTTWIEEPSNYGAAEIDGDFHPFDDQITGVPAGAGAKATGCKALLLTRLSTGE